MDVLFRRHYRDLAAYVRRRADPDLLENVVAETFLGAWRRLDDVPLEARPWPLAVALVAGLSAPACSWACSSRDRATS
ncbi:MAG TPA: hypothetical protein VE985_10310 [Gaiellaceae bacterium]|nr:hypothetical protein [Gaiellaceae bacterium]